MISSVVVYGEFSAEDLKKNSGYWEVNFVFCCVA